MKASDADPMRGYYLANPRPGYAEVRREESGELVGYVQAQGEGSRSSGWCVFVYGHTPHPGLRSHYTRRSAVLALIEADRATRKGAA